MSGPYGFKCVNDNGVLNVSDESRAYTYLGKYGPTYGEIIVACVGFPLVFFEVPYGGPTSVSGFAHWRRSAWVESIKPAGTNLWKVTLGTTNVITDPGNVTYLSTTIRVFGRLDLNPQAVSGPPWGVRVFDGGGACVFDSRTRMLRLAGNTYDMELLLRADGPGSNGGDPRYEYANYDTSVLMPFNMAGKSICANTRGTISGYYFIGQYTDVDNQNVIQYGTMTFGVGYWATGSSLVARKVLVDEGSFETNYPTNPNNGNAQNVYTRLAVIDNNLFP